jgi:hypothetical protein
MNNQYEGQGGSYLVDAAGELKLIERTREPGEDPPEPAEAAPQEQPASAGIFSPVAPAEQPTTTE